MKQKIAFVSALFALQTLIAANVSVSVDENNQIQPLPAREALERVFSATVVIDTAERKAEVLTNLAHQAIDTLNQANELLTKRGNFAVVAFTAIGMKDAVKAGGESPTEGRIDIVDVKFDDTTDPDNVLSTLTWQYTLGRFTNPGCIGTAQIEVTNSWGTVQMSKPEQVTWGTNEAWRATATIPKSEAQQGKKYFLKISAKPDAPIDDGQVFDIYSDGTDFTIIFEPGHKYEVRIISGRWTNVRMIE